MQVIKHPFRVRKTSWGLDRFGLERNYYVYNENTKEVWRYFDSRRDAYEFAFYSNGNIGQYSTTLWY